MKSERPPKRPKLKWDPFKRHLLCCLFRFFERDKKQIQEIFSHIVKDHLNQRGIQGLFPFTTLNAQWVWMKSTQHPDWIRVHGDTADGYWSEILADIRSTAKTLKLRLREKASHNDPIGTSSADTHCTNTVSGNPFAITPSSLSSSIPLPDPKTPESVTLCDVQQGASRANFKFLTIRQEKNQQNEEYGFSESVVASHGKICLWCGHESKTEAPRGAFQQQVDEIYDPTTIEDPNGVQNDRSDQLRSPDLTGLPADEIPPILYRWYDCDSQGINSEHGLVSGLFRVSPYVGPDKISNLDFETYFRNHVSKKKTLSPFISFFRSPLAPLHRAMQSAQPTATLVVIDTKYLDSKVFSAHQLAKHYVGTFTYSWRGLGEFEVWGRVPAKAIVFVSKISTIVNLALASRHRDIDRLLQLSLIKDSFRCNKELRDKLAAKRKSPYKSGRTFGKFLTLLQFPRLYWEPAAHRFMKCWGWRTREEIDKFMSGLTSEIPYSNEELSDSESEGYPITPQATPEKNSVSQLQQRSPSPSDMDYEPSDTLRSSTYSTDDEVNEESENASGIMEERPETIDDGHFSTHESLSSFGSPWENPPTSRMQVLTLSPEGEDRASHVSDYEMCLDNSWVVVSSHFQDQTYASAASEENADDCLVWEGGLWNRL